MKKLFLILALIFATISVTQAQKFAYVDTDYILTKVPDFVQADHPVFVDFVKDYFSFLEAGRLTLTQTINYITLETNTSTYIIDEQDEERIVTEIGEDYDLDQIRPYTDFIFEIFDTTKIMWGSDWPVLTMAEKYENWFDIAHTLIPNLSNDEKINVFSHTAKNFYKI